MLVLWRLAATIAIFTASATLSSGVAPEDFEGEITASMARGSAAVPLLYNVGSKTVRIEVTGSNQPDPIDLVDRNSGALTLVFPHNRSFVHVVPGVTRRDPANSPVPTTGALALPGVPSMPATPIVPPSAPLELKATGEKQPLLGLDCEKYEVTQRGQTLEIWATARLFAFAPYLPGQRPRYGPRLLEEQWAELLTAKKLFPVRVVLHSETGTEAVQFEVKVITPRKITDETGTLFSPPRDYFESKPLPF